MLEFQNFKSVLYHIYMGYNVHNVFKKVVIITHEIEP
jgi:hypothetical protein